MEQVLLTDTVELEMYFKLYAFLGMMFVSALIIWAVDE